jgi:hypothetical protein
MGRLALLASTILTVGYVSLADMAMTSDRAATIARVITGAEKIENAAHTVDTGKLWYGGTLPTITVTGPVAGVLETAIAPGSCRPARAI